MPETVVLCGGAPPPHRRARVVRLSTEGAEANVELRSEDIGRRMLASLPATLADLLDVATYIYCADQLVSRGGSTGRQLGADWRRELRFVIPVREPDRWSSPEVTQRLERLLAFMSDDNTRFEFVRARDGPTGSGYFDFGSEVDEVALFSGGLDSLSGAVDRLSKGASRLLLVSHQSSTKIAKRQRELARELAARFPNRVLHIPVRVTMRGIEAVETTQRTRSFLFGALAATVAQVGHASRLALFENGIVSINLPIAGQVLGTAATRTTHPRVVRDLAAFLSALLEREVVVENPYLWKTKAEVAEVLRASGHGDLARHTVSCSRVYWMTRLHTHCGRCSQCLDRRFGALAAGIREDDPETMYEVDLLTGAREEDLDQTMAESFVRHALELKDMTERTFMSRFGGEVARVISCIRGMSSNEVACAMLDLHHRHAVAVRAVLEDGYREHAHALAGQTLPPSCILRLVAGPGGIVAQPEPPRQTIESAPPDMRDFGRSSQIRLAIDAQARRVLIEGAPAIEGPAAFGLIQQLVELSQQDRAEGRAPENHGFIKAARLAKLLRVAEPSLRRCIRRIRVRLSDAFETQAGLPIFAEALIENAPWRGYRLNPAVLILSLNEINSPEADGHDLAHAGSQLHRRAPSGTMA